MPMQTSMIDDVDVLLHQDPFGIGASSRSRRGPRAIALLAVPAFAPL